MPPSYLNCWDFEKNWWINKGGSYLPRSYLNCCPKLSPLQKQKKIHWKNRNFQDYQDPWHPWPVLSYHQCLYMKLLSEEDIGVIFVLVQNYPPPFSYSGTILDSLKNLNFCYLFHLNIIWVLYYRKA